MHYPKWLYHPIKDPLIVQDKAAHDAMGDDWFESPAEIAKLEAQAPVEEKKPRRRATKEAKE